jgi:hypothetical protein
MFTMFTVHVDWRKLAVSSMLNTVIVLYSHTYVHAMLVAFSVPNVCCAYQSGDFHFEIRVRFKRDANEVLKYIQP